MGPHGLIVRKDSLYIQEQNIPYISLIGEKIDKYNLENFYNMLAIFNHYNIPNEIRGNVFEYLNMNKEFKQVLYDIETGIHEKRVFYQMKKSHALAAGRFWRSSYRQVTEAEDIYRPRYSSTIIHSREGPTVILSDKYVYEPVGWASPRSHSSPHNTCVYCGNLVKISEETCSNCKLTRNEAELLAYEID